MVKTNHLPPIPAKTQDRLDDDRPLPLADLPGALAGASVRALLSKAAFCTDFPDLLGPL